MNIGRTTYICYQCSYKHTIIQIHSDQGSNDDKVINKKYRYYSIESRKGVNWCLSFVFITLYFFPTQYYWKEKGFCQDFDEEKISYLITYFHNENIKNNNQSMNPNIIEMMKDKSKEGKIKIINRKNVV